jgi:guanylate kinase
MTHWNEFDYVVINDDFDRALTDLTKIVDGDGESLTASRPELRDLTNALLTIA